MDVAEGVLQGDRVVVGAGRGASALHAKGSYGAPQSGGSLDLTLVESSYLLEAGRIKVRMGAALAPLEELLGAGLALDDRFEMRYLVYRDFRERGFVIREEPASSGFDFSVRPRGATARAPSKAWVVAVSERSEFSLQATAEFAKRAVGLAKEPMVAVVDEEGDITYYSFEPGLKGSKAQAGRLAAAEGTLRGNQVIVVGEAAHALHRQDELLGKPLKHLLRLSLIEAAYLAQAGRLDLRSGGENSRPITAEDLIQQATYLQRDFVLRLAVYRALRAQGLVPKTGFKYGAHFRVYDREGGSTHARYLVHAVPAEFSCAWPELARAVRLSHGVKKRLVYALAGPSGEVEFLRVKWTRP